MRPYVILSAAMTLDGKIATETGSSNISGEKDLERVHELRKECDAIMVGIGTVLADDPRLTVHKVDANPEDNPVRVVVDSKCRTPIAARITNKDARTIIAGANEYKYDFLVSDRYDSFSKRGIDFFWSGDKRVDLVALMSYLHEEGIEKLMLEGGATLNFSMIKAGLIDEIRLCVAPMVVGGANAKTLFDGDGYPLMDLAKKLELVDSYELDKDLILTYKAPSYTDTEIPAPQPSSCLHPWPASAFPAWMQFHRASRPPRSLPQPSRRFGLRQERRRACHAMSLQSRGHCRGAFAECQGASSYAKYPCMCPVHRAASWVHPAQWSWPDKHAGVHRRTGKR